ncbi:MAG: DUF4249 family protein [Candidatus Marinimicrobia bacterium]|nr:DUF4249 family protein [Candidatus Neomarinimicrobiota bacterium]MCF7827873.1 DUF4249 family protein [Candidatus Neomarinimicrobiota bacterium]MCF7879372.1 DUF4249 family protein [Candidatus Neomarinimicrobiota bacterium]
MDILNNVKNLIIIGTIAFLTTTCSLPTDPGPQPKDIIETEFEPGYNILGVLRNDGTAGSSFIRVEEAFKLTEITDEFTPVVEGVTVQLREESAAETTQFTLTEDSLRGKIYSAPSFQPEACAKYSLTITGSDLPDVTGEVVVPGSPMLDSASVSISGNTVNFTLEEVPGIALYEIYLICEKATVSVRRFPAHSGEINISINYSGTAGSPQSLEIYGYESNMMEYITAPITIKPQTYRETVTTVSGGYGVFGAVSKMVYQF